MNIKTHEISTPTNYMSDRTAIKTFLKKHVAGKGKKGNFTGLGTEIGVYNFEDGALDDFYRLYAKFVLKQNSGNHLSLTEKQGSCSPFIIDLDLKFDHNDDQISTESHDAHIINSHSDDDENDEDGDEIDEKISHFYDDFFVIRIIESCFAFFSKYIDITDVVCYVHERPEYYIATKKNGALKKDGLHLVFPNIRCPSRLKFAARDHIMKTCRSTLESLGCCNEIPDIVDEAVIEKNNWFVYGCGKPGPEPYTVTKVFDHRTRQLPFDPPISSDQMIEFIKLFSVQGDIETVKWLPGAQNNLPEISSKVKAKVNKPKNAGMVNRSSDTDEIFSPGRSSDNPSLSTLETVINGLADSRADDYISWRDNAMAIFNTCYENNYENDYASVATRLIHAFSKKFSHKYDSAAVDQGISSFAYRSSGFKYATLLHHLKSDNFDLYKKLKSSRKSVETEKPLSTEEAKGLAFQIMSELQFVPHTVDKNGITIDSVEQCNLGWNCNLPDNRWFDGRRLMRAGDTYLLLGTSGLQMINANDFLNPWPKEAWPVDSSQLRQALPHITFNNCTFNIGSSSNSPNIEDNQSILPCDFDKDGLLLYQADPSLRNKFLLSLNGLHNAVAKYFYAIYTDKFRCIKNIWFEFNSHIWEQYTQGSDIITAELSSEAFLEPYTQALNFYRHSGIAGHENKAKKIDTLLRNLQSAPFKHHVLNECAETFRFLHRDFADDIDRSYLTPFTNGVLDLKDLNFRNGRPQDNMTKSMQIDYLPFDEQNPHQKHIEILKWFEEVQPDQNLRDYLKKLTGLLLTPDTNLQKVFLFCGNGRNAKSLFINKILKPAIGTFYGTGATQLLTQKREKANETNEALMDLVGKRVVVFNEPSNNDIIQAETLKTISGEDEMTVRGLHQKQQKFTPTFKPIIVCNDKPKVSEDSYAVWRRIRVIDWPVRFTESPAENDPFEKKIDPFLEERIKSWPKYFAGLMVYWLQQYRKEGLIEPCCVTKHTKLYEEEHDEWTDFRDEYIQEIREQGIMWTELLEIFKAWFAQTYTHKSPPKDNKIKQYFVKKYGNVKLVKIQGKAIWGWKHLALKNTAKANDRFSDY